jgi:hypothetical protein
MTPTKNRPRKAEPVPVKLIHYWRASAGCPTADRGPQETVFVSWGGGGYAIASRPIGSNRN